MLHRLFKWAFAAAVLALILVLLAVISELHYSDPQINCNNTCLVKMCNTFRMRYGKFCGLGWTGCPGEKPCDDADSCCQIHDECVGEKGLMSLKCHEKFQSCLKEVQKFGKTGFSPECPYDSAVPVMLDGFDMIITLVRMTSPTIYNFSNYLHNLSVMS